jgi:ABC-2 type transport system ATP-binding protein
MTAVIDVAHLTKTFKDVTAVDDLTLQVQENSITGLLGRNGSGKTTTMSILTAQDFPTAGTVRVFGEDPLENARVLSRLCFVRESQKYPDDFTAGHALRAAAMFYPRWDEAFARTLVADLRLPLTTRIKKLSRGQLSAVGVVIGLASRAEITFFDEPYLGLDAVARSLFYERLLQDYGDHPRTIILSSHLIDEISDLIEDVLLIDDGRFLLHESTDALRGRAVTLTGDAEAVIRVIGTREVLNRESLGRVTSVTVMGTLTASEADEAHRLGLEHSPVPLQQLIVRLSQRDQRSAKSANQIREKAAS